MLTIVQMKDKVFVTPLTLLRKEKVFAVIKYYSGDGKRSGEAEVS